MTKIVRPPALQAAIDEHAACGKLSTWIDLLEAIDEALALPSPTPTLENVLGAVHTFLDAWEDGGTEGPSPGEKARTQAAADALYRVLKATADLCQEKS